MAPATQLPRHRLVLVGAGRVGTAVAELLRRAGHSPVGVASRSRASVERAQRLLGCPAFELDGGTPPADVYLLGVVEDALAEVTGRLSPHLEPGAVVVHFAGAAGIRPLESVLRGEMRAAALHPVQACPDVATAVAHIPGSAWGVTCSDGLENWARAIVEVDLGGTAVSVAEDVRPLWHAASVMTSNGIAALLAVGEAILEAIGVEHPEVALGPLAAGTVANARRTGAAVALTGPIVRGETATLSRQVAALAERRPELMAEYALVVRSIVAAALRTGRIDGDRARTLEAVLR